MTIKELYRELGRLMADQLVPEDTEMMMRCYDNFLVPTGITTLDKTRLMTYEHKKPIVLVE